MLALRVAIAFAGYPVGALIEDSGEVAGVLASPFAQHVVKVSVEAPPAEPAEPEPAAEEPAEEPASPPPAAAPARGSKKPASAQ